MQLGTAVDFGAGRWGWVSMRISVIIVIHITCRGLNVVADCDLIGYKLASSLLISGEMILTPGLHISLDLRNGFRQPSSFSPCCVKLDVYTVNLFGYCISHFYFPLMKLISVNSLTRLALEFSARRAHQSWKNSFHSVLL